MIRKEAIRVKHKKITRREFIEKSAKVAVGAAASSFMLSGPQGQPWP